MVKKRRALSECTNALRLAYVNIEVELAEVYCQLAVTMVSKGSFERNLVNAQEAFDTALRFSRAVRMSNGETESFLHKVAGVRSLLAQLKADHLIGPLPLLAVAP